MLGLPPQPTAISKFSLPRSAWECIHSLIPQLFFYPTTAPSASHFSLRAQRKVTKRKGTLLVGFCCAKLPSLRHDFTGRHDGPSLARPGSIGRPAQLTPKIAPPLGQKKGSVPTLRIFFCFLISLSGFRLKTIESLSARQNEKLIVLLN